RLGEEHEAREERRHGVGEDDLADDAVVVLLLVAQLGGPVAGAELGVLQVLVRVLVLLPPGVEVVAVLLVEVLPGLGVAGTGVAVGGDDDVVIVGLHGHLSIRPWCRSFESAPTLAADLKVLPRYGPAPCPCRWTCSCPSR